MAPIRNVAILGLGNQGRHHAAAALKLLKSRQIKHLFLCDSEVTQLDMYTDLENVTLATDAHQLIRSKECQAFVVAVPNFLHEDLTLEVLKQGGQVLKEKPLAISLDSAQRMNRVACETGGYLEVIQQRFYHPGFAAVAKAMPHLGTLRFVDYHFSVCDDKLSWYWSKRDGGGAWLGIGWHVCNVLCSLFGIPHEIRAHFFSGKEKKWLYDTEDSVIGEIQFNKLLARFSVSVVGMAKNESLFLEGTSGSLSFDRKQLRLSLGMKNVIVSDFGAFDWSNAYQSQLADFLSRASAGVVGVNNLGLRTMSVLEAGKRSADSGGEPVDIVEAHLESPYLPRCSNGTNFYEGM